MRLQITAFLLLFSVAVAYSASPVGGALPQTYKILALGDVITTGSTSVGVVSYLFPLWEKLLAAGYVVEFVGPNSTGTRIGNIKQAAIGNETGTAEAIDASITSTYTSYQADVVLIHAGHNHDAVNSPVPAIIAAHKSIIAKIRAINPNVKIVVAQVIPSGKLPKYGYIPELNTKIAEMAAEYETANKPIYVANMADGFNWQTDCLGNNNFTHPNATGAEKMSVKWANAIKTALGAAEESYNPEIVTYKQPTGAPVKLHIFRPANVQAGEKRPAIIYFFGGGWTSGTPLQFYREAYYWASKGMVAVCADYRIQYTHGTTPIESIRDAKSAVRWLRENATAYNIDPDKICASGASAGGHLAAATATLKQWDEANENAAISSKPNLLLLNYPVYDNGPTGYGPTDFRAQYLTVSPLHNIDTTIPPCLVFLGTADAYIPVATAQLFQQKMKDVGVESELILYQGAFHPIFSYQKGKTTDYYSMLAQSEAFLVKHGYINNPSTVFTPKSTNKYTIFPNPASGFFQISGLNNTERVTINNLNGQNLLLLQSYNSFGINHLSDGVYLVSVENERYKLVVKR